MPFTVGLSQHADPGIATGEIVGRVLETLGVQPDVAVLFTSGEHMGNTDEIAAAVLELLNPGAFIGTTAVSVAAGEREIEEETAAVLWVGSLGGGNAPRARAVRLGGVPDPAADDEALAAALDEVHAAGDLSMIVLADPYSYPVDAALGHWAERWPDVSVLGGLSSGAPMPGGNRIVVDGGVHRDGAAALIVGGSATVTHLVSQGCRPIGQPYIITEAEGNVVKSLGGMPPFERLQQVFSKLDPADQRLVQRGLHVGRVTDERKIDFERGDFLIRGVLGADRESGAIAIGDEAPIGATVQFHVRDADTANEDLRAALAHSPQTEGALLFTCNGRGTHLFDAPHHDASALVDQTSAEVAGMFCAGEIGPVGARSYVHGFTASMALFSDADGQ
ncbi:MAG: FIST C-terminal domain-containing protein [Acidimicrobiaceae bacterium]|nr:FIST C-terminal domain-containing protein [Acidimicrobiaceae bacterium]MDE0499363.1 FIST C-terminal domain-containing protein [Acidimicrobiaceae bacterium]MDE0677132.1 FIST C-terminal domain-containing protein [Acidimicrobiaceae bacterium]